MELLSDYRIEVTSLSHSSSIQSSLLTRFKASITGQCSLGKRWRKTTVPRGFKGGRKDNNEKEIMRQERRKRTQTAINKTVWRSVCSGPEEDMRKHPCPVPYYSCTERATLQILTPLVCVITIILWTSSVFHTRCKEVSILHFISCIYLFIYIFFLGGGGCSLWKWYCCTFYGWILSVDYMATAVKTTRQTITIKAPTLLSCAFRMKR